MRILWVKVGGLWPPDAGGRIRSLHLLKQLARRHRVTLATTHAPGEDIAPLAAHLPECEAIVSVPARIPKRGSLRFLLALARSWLTRRPVDVAKFRVRALAREVRRRLAAGEVDLCVADFLSATPNVPLAGDRPVLLFAHNVEHLIWKRLAGTEPRPWRRALLEIEWRRLRTAEARACGRATLTAAVSETDRERLADLTPGARVCAIPTGVDTTYFTPSGASPAERGAAGLVFTGSMDWHPNEDGVLFFLESILPAIRRGAPDVTFTVAGRNPGPRLREAAARAGARVTGSVDDIRPFVAEAAVYVVPLRIGGGTRLKILEALAMGKPVVSTTIGAEGLPLVPGLHYLREDDPERFASAVVGLLGSPARRRSLGRAGRELVEARASWSRVGIEFEARCREAVALHRTARRLAGRAPLGLRAALRRILPAPLRAAARACARLDPKARSIYWRLRLRRIFAGRRGGPAAPGPRAPRRILFVCRGNIIRSPMAEALANAARPEGGGAAPVVASAGVAAVRGRRADPRARVVAREFGVSLEGHRARPVSDEMIGWADRIVALDSLVEADLLARYPEARSKTRLLLASVPGNGARPLEIADPYDGDLSAVRRCYRRLQAALRPEGPLPVEASAPGVPESASATEARHGAR